MPGKCLSRDLYANTMDNIHYNIHAYQNCGMRARFHIYACADRCSFHTVMYQHRQQVLLLLFRCYMTLSILRNTTNDQ